MGKQGGIDTPCFPHHIIYDLLYLVSESLIEREVDRACASHAERQSDSARPAARAAADLEADLRLLTVRPAQHVQPQPHTHQIATGQVN